MSTTLVGKITQGPASGGLSFELEPLPRDIPLGTVVEFDIPRKNRIIPGRASEVSQHVVITNTPAGTTTVHVYPAFVVHGQHATIARLPRPGDIFKLRF